MSMRKQSGSLEEIVITTSQSKLPSSMSIGIKGAEGVELVNPKPSIIDDSDSDNTETPLFLGAPRNIVVLSQSVTFSEDGSQKVTLVIEFDEVEGGEYYESRISKP